MGSLEHILVVLSVAIEKDEIGKAELLHTLKRLNTAACPDSHPDEPEALRQLNDQLHSRFEYLLYPEGL